MRMPTKPRKPSLSKLRKPVEPKKTINQKVQITIEDGDYVVIDGIGYYIEITDDGWNSGCEVTGYGKEKETVPNPNYKREMGYYKTALKKYEKKLAVFPEKEKKHKEKLEEYETKLKAYKSLYKEYLEDKQQELQAKIDKIK